MPTSKNNGHQFSTEQIVEIRDAAVAVSSRASEIAHVSSEVTEGVDGQGRSLESALSITNELAASLKETANQAESLAASSEELASASH